MTPETSQTESTVSYDESVDTDVEQRAWRAGVLAGIVAGLVMGAMMIVAMPGAIEAAIPALVGLSGGAAGLTVHLAISAIFGVVFAAIVVFGGLTDYADRLLSSIGLGVAYGIVLWIVAAAVVMPLWLGAVGFPNAPAVPNLSPTSALAHIAYGVVLGGLYPVIQSRI